MMLTSEEHRWSFSLRRPTFEFSEIMSTVRCHSQGGTRRAVEKAFLSEIMQHRTRGILTVDEHESSGFSRGYRRARILKGLHHGEKGDRPWMKKKRGFR